MKSISRAFAGFILAIGVVACYESPDVTVYEPGVYKGAQDPLLDADVADRAKTLEERFKLVQTDR